MMRNFFEAMAFGALAFVLEVAVLGLWVFWGAA